MENWRTMPLHSFGYEVQCGGCERWVTSVAAKDVGDARAGKGRCRDCIVKSPILVEAPTPPAAEAPLEPVAPDDGALAEVSADPGSPIPGVVEEGAGEASEVEGEPEGTPPKGTPDDGAPEKVPPEEMPRRRR